MMKHRVLLYSFVFGFAASRPAVAQRGMVPVRGVVFDSLRGQPIRNATVSIAGNSHVITTDSRGRFQFDSVSPGAYRFSAQHPVLDSIGLSGLLARSTITDGHDEVLLAVPSFTTLWRVACGPGHVPEDSAIVYGTIRAASDGAAVPNARVELVWSDLVLDKKRHVVQRRWHIETRSNSVGGYALCGIAPGLGLRVQASGEAGESGGIDMAPVTTRVQRRDLLIDSAKDPDSVRVGAIAGLVSDASGQPVEGARIVMPGMPESRTDAEGKFVLAGVPVGTRQLEVLDVGTVPNVVVADVVPRSTTNVAVTLQRVVMLNAVRTRERSNVRVFAAEFNERRRLSFGYARDSVDLLKYNLFVDALRDVPSMIVKYGSSTVNVTVPDGRGGSCVPDILIDGARAGVNNVLDLYPKELAGFEAYPRAAHIPARFVPPGIHPQCGMVLIWTKYGMKNR